MPKCDTVKGATSPRPDSINLPTNPHSRCLTVFKKKKVMISDDLELSNRTLKVTHDHISSSGGVITNNVRDADIYVCHWRDGSDYKYASSAGIDVGNLSWLYHLIAHNTWTSPLRRLLHYPLPRNGIPGFEKYRITLSNYGGEARTYLENIIIATGAEFTKSMKQDNTHLITARKTSEKCQAAQEWGIEMINHLWIEESYARCAPQKLTDPRYTHFPPRTNLGEIIGQTQFDLDILEHLYFPKDKLSSCEDSELSDQCSDIAEKKQDKSSSEIGSLDTTFNTHEDRETPVRKPTMPRSSHRPEVSHSLATPSNRRNREQKENETPSSTGSRNAKDKAVSRIHGLASDMALYEKEKKRKGSVWGGERAANIIDKQRTLDHGPSPTSKNLEIIVDQPDEVTGRRTTKRQKIGHLPAEIKLVITGYKRWLQDLPRETIDTVRVIGKNDLFTDNQRKN